MKKGQLILVDKLSIYKIYTHRQFKAVCRHNTLAVNKTGENGKIFEKKMLLEHFKPHQLNPPSVQLQSRRNVNVFILSPNCDCLLHHLLISLASLCHCSLTKYDIGLPHWLIEQLRYWSCLFTFVWRSEISATWGSSSKSCGGGLKHENTIVV